MDDSTINHPIVCVRDQYLSTPPWLTLYLSLFLYISHPYPNRVVELSNCSFPPQFTTRTPPANTSHVSILFFPYPHHPLTLWPQHLEKFRPQHLEKFWPQHLENFWFQHLENFHLSTTPPLVQHLGNLGLGLVTSSKSSSVYTG